MDQTQRKEYRCKPNDIMEQMINFRFSNPELLLTFGEELLQLGELHKDNYLKAFAYFYSSFFTLIRVFSSLRP